MSRVIAAFSQFFKGDGSPLANGYLRFLISQTTSTEKATYADVDQTIPNANPVQLDGEGRCPNVFGQGIYKVVLYDVNPVTGLPGMMVQTFDPIVADYQSEGAGGNFAEWESGTIYQIGQIVIYNGLYYRSHIANNVGNQPDISADSWERIDFLRFWNLDVTYGLDDVVIYGSQLYFSLQAGNLNHVPSTSPAWWDPVGSGTVLLNWQESGTAFIPVSAGYDLGSAANFIGDFYQGDNSIHYFGTGQDASLYFDSNDFYITTVGDLIAGTLDASEIILTTQSFARWRIKSDGHLIPDANLDIGGAVLPVGDVYQGSDQHLYIGDSQQIDINYDGTDIYLSIGANAWALLSAGHIEPQTDATFNIGSASNRVKQVSVSDDPTLDDHVVRNAYLTAMLYEEPIFNYLDNADFHIWQRDITQSISGIHSVDRWPNNNLISTKLTSRQAFTVGQIDVPGNPKYFIRTVVTTGGTAASVTFTGQIILDVSKLSGSIAVLTFWAKADSNKNIATEFIQDFGTGGTPSSTVTGIGVTTHNLTTSWQQFIAPISIPSIAGKNLGTDGNDYLRLFIWFDAGSDYNSRTNNLGNQSGTFDIADVQLFPGSNIKAFQRKDFNRNLLDCLPYYQKSFNYEQVPANSTYLGHNKGVGAAVSANALTTNVDLQIPMKVLPQITVYSASEGTPTASQWTIQIGGTYYYATITTADRVSTSQFRLSLTTSGLSTYAAYPVLGHWTADTGY